MYGMDAKKMMRKKAMDSMMKEGPSIAIKIAKKSIEEESAPEEMMQDKEGGLVSMMVSPEEKEMILSMRKGDKGEQMMPGMEKEEAMA